MAVNASHNSITSLKSVGANEGGRYSVYGTIKVSFIEGHTLALVLNVDFLKTKQNGTWPSHQYRRFIKQ